MAKIKRIDIGTVAVAIIIATTLTGCFGFKVVPEESTPKELSYTVPDKQVSKDIVNEVEKNGEIKLNIQSMCINNSENLNVIQTYYRPSISLIVLDDEVTQSLNINIKSPVDSKDEHRQGDILVYIPDISNIHYIDDGEDYIQIKDSQNKYYESNKKRYHSYIADIYINKNNGKSQFGSNEHKEGKNSIVQTSTQQIK